MSNNQTGQSGIGEKFLWVKFYQAVADALLRYKDDRKSLVKAVHNIVRTTAIGDEVYQDEFLDDTKGPLKDICPIYNYGYI